MSATEPRCPGCRGTLVRVESGMPDPDLVEAAKRGEVALGGCEVDVQDPSWVCSACDRQWLGTADGEVLPVQAGQRLADVVVFLERRLFDELRSMIAAEELTVWNAEAEHSENANLLAAALEALTGQRADAIRHRASRRASEAMGPPPPWAPGSSES